MVGTRSILDDFAVNDLLNFFFYSWPKDNVKPPVSVMNASSSNGNGGVELQLAVAGYGEEDLNIYIDGDSLYIRGDNTRGGEVHGKFASSFWKEYILSDKLDKEKVSIKLENGLLSIRIPCKDGEDRRVSLFGKLETGEEVGIGRRIIK